MTTLRETAWAKVNLTLDVLGRRMDGYHDLRTVMQTVSLADTLTIRIGTGRWSLECADPSVPAGEENLALRAARAYCDAAGLAPAGIEIELEKRIPMQAGLGGGSADAAAVLRALNRAYRALPDEVVLRLAEQLGADVPFCVHGGTMLCEGKGERMRPLPPLGRCWFVLCRPDFSVSTPALFSALDAYPARTAAGTAAVEQALLRGTLPRGTYTNRFECLIEQAHPEIGALRGQMIAGGALLASLTGTGSVFFGLFDDLQAAQTLQRALLPDYPLTFLAHPV